MQSMRCIYVLNYPFIFTANEVWMCYLEFCETVFFNKAVRYNGDVHDTIEPSTTHVVVADDDSPHLEEGSSTHCLQVKDRDCRSFLLV